jgi:hypothetical protein
METKEGFASDICVREDRLVRSLFGPLLLSSFKGVVGYLPLLEVLEGYVDAVGLSTEGGTGRDDHEKVWPDQLQRTDVKEA